MEKVGRLKEEMDEKEEEAFLANASKKTQDNFLITLRVINDQSKVMFQY